MIHEPAAAIAWWHALQPDPDRERPGDRAALARLRRCATVPEAMSEPAAIALFRACRADHPEDLVAVALAAAVLAHLREDHPGSSVARRIGPQGYLKDGLPDVDTALMKPIRFQRLMTAVTGEERLAAMRRLLALADRKLNLRDLSAALLVWTEQRRRRWTYDYWDAGQPAPAPGTPTREDTAP